MVALALGSLGVLVYTYFAYPVLIALLARAFPLRLRRDPGHTPLVSAIIPVYNARSYVRAKIESLLALDYPEDRLEILLCSDCSDDGSDEILAEFAARYPERVRVFRSEKRSGKPAAVNLMRQHARGTILLMTDIRQPLSRRCLRELVSRFVDERVGAVSGNLVLEGSTGAGFYWKYENWIRKSEGSFRSMVGVTGPIYAVRKSDMSDLPRDIILDDMWVPMNLRLSGKHIVFAPDAEAYDAAFEDDRELGRKVRTLAGNYQLFALLPKLLVPLINPSWFEVFSHKILRLLCPWALLALLAATALALARSWSSYGEQELHLWQALAAGQVVFYLLALLGKRASKLGGIARTFVVLNYAAVAGLWRYVTGKQRVTW